MKEMLPDLKEVVLSVLNDRNNEALLQLVKGFHEVLLNTLHELLPKVQKLQRDEFLQTHAYRQASAADDAGATQEQQEPTPEEWKEINENIPF